MNFWEFLAMILSAVVSIVVFVLFIAFMIFLVGISIPIYIVVLLFCGAVGLGVAIWDKIVH